MGLRLRTGRLIFTLELQGLEEPSLRPCSQTRGPPTPLGSRLLVRNWCFSAGRGTLQVTLQGIDLPAEMIGSRSGKTGPMIGAIAHGIVMPAKGRWTC